MSAALQRAVSFALIVFKIGKTDEKRKKELGVA